VNDSMVFSALLIVLSLLLFTHCEIEDGISYVVGPGKRDCFYRVLAVGDIMDFDLQVLSGGDMDITVTIAAPTKGLLLEQFQETEVSEEIQIEEDGPYEVCFDNTFSTFTEKVVYFDLGIDENNRTGLDHIQLFKDIPVLKDDVEHVQQLLKSMDNIGFKIEVIAHHQATYRSKHSRHKYLQDTNLRLVTWFSLGSCLVMIVVGVLQVVLIRNLFETKNNKGMQNSL